MASKVISGGMLIDNDSDDGVRLWFPQNSDEEGPVKLGGAYGISDGGRLFRKGGRSNLDMGW